MFRRSFVLTVLALALLVAAASPHGAVAQEAVTLRIATMAPRGSTWHRVFTAWGNTLRQQTGGRLTVQVVSGGSAADERDLVRRFRAGEIDGASFTAIGLGQIARPSLVLQAPGVFDDYASLDRARTRMAGELDAIFAEGGATLLGWSDYGKGRIFSRRPIARPADFRGAHAWAVQDDPMFPEFLQIVGATGVTVPMSDVGAALADGRLDTVVASATAVSGLQWHTRLTHVTSQSNAVLVGATLLSKAKFDSLPADLQQALRTTGAQAHETLQRTVRRDDDRFFETVAARMTQVDAAPHEAEWRRVAEQARDRGIGRIYSRELLQRAITAARP